MLPRTLLFITVSLLLIANVVLGQAGSSAVPFLRIQPSPSLNGMAGSYTALPTDDAFGRFYNPAQLGHFGSMDNLAFHTANVDWLPQFNFNDLILESEALALGYRFKKDYLHPFSIGLGYINTLLNLGHQTITDESGNVINTFEPREWYNAYTLGLQYTSWFSISAGYTFKSVVSKVGPYNAGKAKANAIDFGFIFNLPLITAYEKLFNFGDTIEYSKLRPTLNLSIGYSKHNLRDGISYTDTYLKEPLPRQLKLGYGLRFGLSTELINGTPLKPILVSWSSEANDILLRRGRNLKNSYQDNIGDIQIIKNIVLSESNDLVENRHGYNFQFLEILTFSKGQFQGGGFVKIKTSGYRIQVQGFFKLIRPHFENSMVQFLLKHLNITYSSSKYTQKQPSHPLNNTKFKGFMVSFHGL
ncbi:MAG: hypothetical protein GF313_15525 [Caldithrix sp.]|nr:hypothetical protein [Caldithrix sp.]